MLRLWSIRPRRRACLASRHRDMVKWFRIRANRF